MRKKIKSFDGTKINYDIYGKPGHMWLIFVHGAGGDLTAWKKERSYLHKKGFPTIAIDLRGHGKSQRPEKPQGYKLEYFVNDIEQILKHEKIKNFSIVGHCFGGMIGIMFHKAFPKKAKSYILIDTAYKAPLKLRKLFRSHPLVVRKLNTLLAKNNKEKFSHANYKKFTNTGDYNPRRIFSDITHTSAKSWIFTYENLIKYNGIKTMKKIKQPVLIIEGEKDTIFDVKNAKKINKLIKNSTLKIIPEENHIIVLNNPKAISEEILKFIKTKNLS